jgi:hypothetical protein
VQPKVANKQLLNSINEHNVFVCDFFTGMNISVGLGVIIKLGVIDGGGVRNIA